MTAKTPRVVTVVRDVIRDSICYLGLAWHGKPVVLNI